MLALRLSAHANGVSRLHGDVSRQMWRRLWPGLPLAEVPIGHVTNGVHPRTWIAHDLVDLLDRYLGPDFRDEPTNLGIWDRLDRVSDEELWRTHERRRERLVAFARMRLREQHVRRGATNTELARCEDVLSPYALTICFARRFAAYKRADLLLSDPERLLALLTDQQHPVQLIFAGKAHPHDLAGKEIIRRLVHFAEDPRVRSRVVFLEDYDMTIARYLVSGSDVWLNTPRRPLEASGTSGMKAAMNGVLNVSIRDGWWDEAYDSRLGWAVGQGEQYDDPKLQDGIEGTALYDLLEREVVPQFYARGIDGLPREWIRRMKASMRDVGGLFSSHRMLLEYAEPLLPARAGGAGAPRRRRLRRDEGPGRVPGARAARLAGGPCRGSQLAVAGDPEGRGHDRGAGESRLDGLGPEDVLVELFHGSLSSQGEIRDPRRLAMRPLGVEGAFTIYTADAPADATGRQGYTLRVLPRHPSLAHPFLPGLVKWG